jgi:sugar transferase EpsL
VKRRSQFGKRLFDMALTLPALILLSPLIAVAASLAPIGVGSPILFRQQLTGLLGRPFILIKFRTMTYARNAHGQVKPDVEQMPSIERFLRMTSLDELPPAMERRPWQKRAGAPAPDHHFEHPSR